MYVQETFHIHFSLHFHIATRFTKMHYTSWLYITLITNLCQLQLNVSARPQIFFFLKLQLLMSILLIYRTLSTSFKVVCRENISTSPLGSLWKLKLAHFVFLSLNGCLFSSCFSTVFNHAFLSQNHIRYLALPFLFCNYLTVYPFFSL